MRPTVPYVRWNPTNLARHHRKRTTNDAGCFEELMGISPLPLRIDQYRQRSLDAIAGSWAEYEGEGWDVEIGCYSEARAYFVDSDLVCSITDIGRKEFVTCYHAGHPERKHFHPRWHDNDRSEAAVGNRQLKFKRNLKFDVQGGLIKKFKPVRGVANV